ncbi:type II toxin-antitoxin system RelE family toxin [Methanoregula sp.]|uniref:type II toxin-antitoxin system RelE family toxin n=1 Tax=Methanoregula sp. TaxID=2052170 RepID=UPI003BAEADBC
MAYMVIIPNHAKKQLQDLPPEQAIRILDAIEGFAGDLDYVRYDVRKVKGSPREYPRYRLRSGEYRAVLVIHRNKLIIEVVTGVRKHGGMDY